MISNSLSRLNRGYVTSLLLGGIALFLVFSLIFFPEQAFNASLKGLNIWWEVVFPALLPFFIASEILMGFGVVHLFGVLLEPFMRPLFNVPGSGAFVMAMGLASGNPVGARLASRLREQGALTRTEAERLVSFANTAGPLFMFGAVAVGFFHDVTLGFIIALAHYSAAIIVGLIMRFYHRKNEQPPVKPNNDSFIFARAVKEMHKARLKDGRPLGQLMGDAVVSSSNTLLLIGGLIMLFSVLINLLNMVKFNALLSAVLTLMLSPFGVPSELIPSIVSGLFEITLGSQMASNAPMTIALSWKVAICGAVIGWGGLSVHAQVASILSKTDIRYKPYLIGRVLHSILAVIMTFLLWRPVEQWVQSSSLPAFLMQPSSWHPQYVGSQFNDLSLRLLILSLALFLLGRLFQWKRR